jgi:hypothetical protein
MIFIDQHLLLSVWKTTYYVALKTLNSLSCQLASLTNEKAHFKSALGRYLNTHSFYSVEGFFLFRHGS